HYLLQPSRLVLFLFSISCSGPHRDLPSFPTRRSSDLGTMIEVPAAAIALPGFIGDIDFLSIGTNDLIQYLLATDRNNDALGELRSEEHTSELQSRENLVCRLLLEKKKKIQPSKD